MSTVQTIFTNTMKQMGQEVSNHCEFVHPSFFRSLARTDRGSVFPFSIFSGGHVPHCRRQAVEVIRGCDEGMRQATGFIGL